MRKFVIARSDNLLPRYTINKSFGEHEKFVLMPYTLYLMPYYPNMYQNINRIELYINENVMF